MEYAQFLDALETHSNALRAAAVSAGPETTVPTCPKWTVQRLVRHIGRVQSWVVQAIRNPDGEQVAARDPPEAWEDLLNWWDEQRSALFAEFAAGPDAPAWLPFPRYPRITSSWARRQAHEAAIHRLDAEHALAGSDAANALPTLVFGSDFAADGVDELLAWMMPYRGDWANSTDTGTVVVHAADAGRVWVAKLEAGERLQVEPMESAADPASLHADVTLAGTADAVYRAVWGRPSTALTTGDVELLKAIAAP
ncbi:MAG: maleylpyruvate isomerase family mycothiol-dependent enzyme [Pseudonocardiaceae bacterium]|nr:maleylpyruvate isomerase family mycothiol-dependent enzyme [Pseudonocardiaceae bacterium]